ncbi:tetratricopeptide repeat protein [Variovorax ginsengisoli]|uniref:Tetratricopeptide repeat protein n=1 Tax=Variovorax ginsengisoli TaxID=363844 RepID=A0ABT8S4F6_9BURK|nr:tetratricopeptide repeat protein [Variovorax ginsengisoli]MDN8614634.1 tetratricopeptide repeat protein [Variovorax ginsengisoli]MDO1533804.1 tetratricopeptide repeat protein [Variovorax ginsengisoli]
MPHAAFAPSSRLRIVQAVTALLVALTVGIAHADDYSDVNTLLRQGKADQALAKADAYIAGKPRDPQMRFLRGVILTEQGKQADAVVVFTALTQDFPELPEPYNNLAALYAAQSQFDKARAALEMAIKLNPDYATAHENLGDVYARLAAQSYGRALKLEPGNTTAPPKLALVRQMFGAPAPDTLPPATPAVRKPVRN